MTSPAGMRRQVICAEGDRFPSAYACRLQDAAVQVQRPRILESHGRYGKPWNVRATKMWLNPVIGVFRFRTALVGAFPPARDEVPVFKMRLIIGRRRRAAGAFCFRGQTQQHSFWHDEIAVKAASGMIAGGRDEIGDFELAARLLLDGPEDLRRVILSYPAAAR